MSDSIMERLQEPFEASEVKCKAQTLTKDKTRAMVVHYIDARAVMDRLDDVFGVDGWQDAYDVLPSGDVVCRLSVRVGQEWLTKVDVGSQSEQPDDGDKLKAAFSDALKRAAVKVGIGRYLYSLPRVWAEYDDVKKQVKSNPGLPAWALPKSKPAPKPAANGHANGNGHHIKSANLTVEDFARLEGLMDRAGKTWPDCCKFLRIPESSGLSDVTPEAFAKLEAKLREKLNGGKS